MSYKDFEIKWHDKKREIVRERKIKNREREIDR